jgi:hypothetical protein
MAEIVDLSSIPENFVKLREIFVCTLKIIIYDLW